MDNKKWLIIGGAGYIGAHVIRTFLREGLKVFVLDNLTTGKLERLPKDIKFYKYDCENYKKLNEILIKNNIYGIVHLAALKQARESKREPLKYWNCNINSILGVLNAIKGTGVRSLLFSSSCSIYGKSGEVNEETEYKPISPYGRTKTVSEMIINDCAKELNLSVLNLRYFNVIGNDTFPYAHDTSNECLIPALYNCIKSNQKPKVFGTDFPTPDGSALRDYIDVRDLSDVHFLASKYLSGLNKKEIINLNVGIGKPNSVFEIIDCFSNLLGFEIIFEDCGRNKADPDAVWANNEKIINLFNWKPKFKLKDSIKSFLQSVDGCFLKNN